MTHSRSLHLTLALAAALVLALPGPSRAAEPSEGQSKKAAKAEKKQAEQEAKEEAKAAKADKKGKATKESRRREQIETGAKTAVDWYADALKLYQSGKYLDARGILLPLEDSARAVDIQERVKLLIADTYFEQGGALNLAEALARYKSFLTFFPGSENAAYAQYQLGRSYFKQLGDPDRDQSFTDQAIFEYTKLIENYPESTYTIQARADILEARARRAQHEFEVAEFYWDWNDKRAAASRLMQVLQERPELPAREKALWMCAQALYDTGRRDEGDAYAARLASDYPGSSYISKLNANSQGAIEKQVARQRKEEKHAARTYKAQQRADNRRTRVIRKDSGLPRDVPQTWDVAGGTPAAASSDPAAAGQGPGADEQARQKQREEAAAAAAAKAEAEEQSRAAKEAERDAKRKAQQDAEAAKRAAKEAEEEAKRAAETPEQKAKREKREAKAKAEAERREAEEQRKKAK